MKSNKDLLSKLSKSLFWDVAIHDIDPEKHILFITERVLTRGDLPDFKALIAYYKRENLEKTVVKIKNMDAKTLSFCAAYFSIDKSKFICYNSKPLNQSHWNY